MSKKDNIKPYDGGDAYYEGTDKDYEDFLKSIDGNINSGVDVGTEDEKRIDLGETINLKNVLNMVKKKAGEFGNAAKKVTEDVKDQIKTASEAKKTEALDEANPGVSAQISETAKAAKEHFSAASSDIKEKIEDISNIGVNIDEISKKLAEVSDRTEKMASKQNEIEVKQIESKNNFDRSVNDLRSELSSISSDLGEVKQTINLLAKLNDSIFDLKNTQQNTKNAIAELRDEVERVRKKTVAGVTVISILTAVVIVLQVINLIA